MKYPLGRLVITATCSPGLPMVVRFFVRSSVRPAAAPESTWTAASRSGPAAPAGAGASADCGGGGAGLGGTGAGGTVACGGEEAAAGAGEGAGRVLSSGGEGLMLVCVSPIAASTGLGAGGGALDGLRMIIVFSKSAAVAAVGASLKYLSLCLPISTTSLFCRKCFLIGLPLTIVPLVEPRSSMNESLRIVMIAACSPLTARLSIWMSLWALRPMSVRSLERLNSLSTCPSTLRMSLAMVVVLGITGIVP